MTYAPKDPQQIVDTIMADQQRTMGRPCILCDVAFLAPRVTVVTYGTSNDVVPGRVLHETRWCVYIDGTHVASGTASDHWEVAEN